MEVFDGLPPILVMADTLEVIDGAHRSAAATRLGRRHIPARLFHGTPDEAFLLAVSSNVSHGRPLSSRERLAAAHRLISQTTDWSNRRLAEACGLSATTIAGLRRSIAHDDQLDGRLGRDGRSRPLDPAAQRLRIADAVRADPTRSVRDIAAEIGCSPTTVLAVRGRLADGLDPLPPRLQPPSATPPVPEQWAPDAAFATDERAEFSEWFSSLAIVDSDWDHLVDGVPLGRCYEVADEADRRAKSWLRLAAALNRRGGRQR